MMPTYSKDGLNPLRVPSDKLFQAKPRRVFYKFFLIALCLLLLIVGAIGGDAQEDVDDLTIEAFPVPAGSHPHDVAPAPNGTVWYTAQRLGELGILDSETGETRHIPLGNGSAPHGVIVGPDEAAWITDGGLNAIVRVDGETEEITVYPLPDDAPPANLNTAAFDGEGILWFTGQNGIYGRLDPETGEMDVFDAPRRRGPYGITATPEGEIYYASLAGSYVGHVDTPTGEVMVLEPPTLNQGARRVWSDSSGRIWVSEWNSGNVQGDCVLRIS
jgi:virginiamycin B lyase